MTGSPTGPPPGPPTGPPPGPGRSGGPPPPPPAPPALGRTRRSPPAWSILLLVLAIAGGAGAILLTQRSKEPDTRPSPSPTRAEKTFRSADGDFEFRYPIDWFLDDQAADAWILTSYDPAKAPSLEGLPDGYFKIDLSALPNEGSQTLDDLDVCATGETTTLQSCVTRTINGQTFAVATFRDTFGGQVITDTIGVAIANGKIYRAAAFVPNGRSQTAGLAAVRRIFDSFTIRVPSSPGAARAKGRYGTVAEGVSVDGLTIALLEFMDTRVARDAERAAQFLTPDAKRQYDAHAGGLQLVSPTSNPRYGSYEVLSRESGDATLAGFVVRITEVAGTATSGTFRETIGVGPGETVDGEQAEATILDARREPGCKGGSYDEC